MKQYIDKAAVVAEIERRKHKLLDNIIYERDKEWVVRTAHQLNRIILSLDTLEVKEEPESVDLANAAIEYCSGNKGSDARVRAAFVVGANWQEEQMIDKACKWLSNISLEDMEYKYDGFDTSEGWYKFIEDFRKYMSL